MRWWILLVLATCACRPDDPRPAPAAGLGAASRASSTAGGGGDGGYGAGGTRVTGAGGGSGGQGGAGGGSSLAVVVYRTPDEADVCGPTPGFACTPGDLSFVASEYGTTLSRHDTDEMAYRFLGFVERVGPSNVDVLVLDEAGLPLAGAKVAFYFSSAPTPSRPDEWYPVHVASLTGANGIAGFALANSAYLPCCGCGGPHAIWISEGPGGGTTIPSDLVDGIGMLGGTNHRHLDLVFQRRTPLAPLAAVPCPLKP